MQYSCIQNMPKMLKKFIASAAFDIIDDIIDFRRARHNAMASAAQLPIYIFEIQRYWEYLIDYYACHQQQTNNKQIRRLPAKRIYHFWCQGDIWRIQYIEEVLTPVPLILKQRHYIYYELERLSTGYIGNFDFTHADIFSPPLLSRRIDSGRPGSRRRVGEELHDHLYNKLLKICRWRKESQPYWLRDD